SPHSLVINDVAIGEYLYSAVATDNEGNTRATDHLMITVEEFNDLPLVSIASPNEGSEFTVGEEFVVNVDASDVNGNIVKVELFVEDSLIGEDASGPYAF